MKKWTCLSALILIGNVAVAATSTQHCSNVAGEKIVISKDSNINPTSVQAEFSTPEVASTLSGVWTPEAGFAMNPSQAGDEVILKVSRIKAPGGRCGRCAPIGWDEYYAKLTVGSEVYNFTCEIPELLP